MVLMRANLLNEDVPSGDLEGLVNIHMMLNRGVMRIIGDQARGGGMIEIESFTILPESDPWTVEDQRSFVGENSSHGEPKIGVIIYKLHDGKRTGEIIISDDSKIDNIFSKIGTPHAKTFKRVVGRDPRYGYMFPYTLCFLELCTLCTSHDCGLKLKCTTVTLGTLLSHQQIPHNMWAVSISLYIFERKPKRFLRQS
jgi:hypothetical protein